MDRIITPWVSNTNFANNQIKRNQYPIYYIPFITTFKYFSNKENFYFLLLAIFQLLTLGLLPACWSPTGPFSTAVALTLCLQLEIVRDIFIWVKKFYADWIDNHKKLYCVSKNAFVCMKDLYPGDVIKINKHDVVPADGILIDTESNYAKLSYALLTGESNIHLATKLKIDNTELIKGKLYWEKIPFCVSGKKIIKVDLKSVVHNNSVVKSEYINMLITHCGRDKKDNNKMRTAVKKSRIDCFISSYMTNVSTKMLALIIMINTLVKYVFIENSNILSLIIQNWILFNSLIPFSIKIFLIFIRKVQSFIIKKKYGIEINTSHLIDDINKIDTIISDKTGTVTKNELRLHSILEKGNQHDMLVSPFHVESIKLLTAMAACIHKHDETFCTIEDEIIFNNFLAQGHCHQIEKDIISLKFNSGQTCKLAYIESENMEFTHQRRMSSVVVKDISNGKLYIYTKGSVDAISSRLNFLDKNALEQMVEKLSSRHPDSRLLVVAYKQVKDDNFVEDNLELLGLFGIKDEIQEGAKEAIQTFNRHNISVSLCTGDRRSTAIAISHELGLISKDFIELDREISGPSEVYKGKTLLIDGKKISILPLHTISHARNFVAYNLFPVDKKKLVNELEYAGISTLTIGDGFNDIDMFSASQVSVSIKGDNYVNENSDFVVKKFSNLVDLLDLSSILYNRNSYAINYTFFRCMAIVACLISYSLIKYNETVVSVFSGFVIQSFNFVWCIFPLIYQCLRFEIPFKCNYLVSKNMLLTNNKLITRWIANGALLGTFLTFTTCYFFSFNKAFNDILALMLIISINLKFTQYNPSIIIGPMLYICYFVSNSNLSELALFFNRDYLTWGQ